VLRDVVVTPDHRWVLANRRYETTDLRVGDVVAMDVPKVSWEKASEGFRHGMVFADGTLLYKGRRRQRDGKVRHQMRLCGDKASHLELFTDAPDCRWTYPESANGDPQVYIDRDDNWKELPDDDAPPEYKRAFIEGWMLLDGGRNSAGRRRILMSVDHKAIDWAKRHAAAAGLIVVGDVKVPMPESGYSSNHRWCWTLTLDEPADMSERFLGWTVKGIVPLGVEEVYCAVVPGSGRFVLADGILTGNCNFDRRWLEHHSDYRVPMHRTHDTMIASRILDPVGKAGLKYLAGKMVDRRAYSGQRRLDDGMSENGWNWGTVPTEFEPYWCVPLDTEILTEEGWKTWNSVSEGDRTLGYDGGELAWTSITKVESFKNAPLVRVGSPMHWNTECTPNHRWLYRRREGESYGETNIAPLGEIQKHRDNEIVLTGYAVGGDSPITPDEAMIIGWLMMTYEGPHAKSSSAAKLWKKAGLHNTSRESFVLSLSRESRAAWLRIVEMTDGTTRGYLADESGARKSTAPQDRDMQSAIAMAAFLEGHLPKLQKGRVMLEPEKRLTLQEHPPQLVGRGPVWCPVTELGTWVARDRAGRMFVTGNTYAALDVVLTSQIWDQFRARVEKGTQLEQVYDLEMSVLDVSHRMWRRGMRVDLAYSQRKYDELQKKASELKSWAQRNHKGMLLTSTVQLARFFISADVQITETTPTGAPRIDKKFLEHVVHPDSGYPIWITDVAQAALLVRKCQKFSSTYFENFIKNADSNGIIRPNINTLAARTGRQSISDPALQQCPKNDKSVRNAFLPLEEDHLIVSVDADQIEGRIFANLSGDSQLQKAFLDADADAGADFFTNLGAQLYRDPHFTKDDSRRRLVKGFFYGSLYGAGVQTAAETAGVPFAEMEDLARRMKSSYPGMERFMNELESTMARRQREEGEAYVVLESGRKLPVDEEQLYAALNYCIQGTASELFKAAEVRIDSSDWGQYAMIPVHDEIVFSIPKDRVSEALVEIPELMADKEAGTVPYTAGGEGGFDRWGGKIV
jgi:DNA polymerase I-like protein with 3'-5' exonuclease and polymerase domains